METIKLTPPQRTGDISVEEALQKRRSVREYSGASLSPEELSQLAWAAQGITGEPGGLRTAPSAGATFPIEIYLLVTGVDGIPDGLYHYINKNHTLEPLAGEDRRRQLQRSALGQDSIVAAPVVMVITGVLRRTEQRYGGRALRYLYKEAGHVAQNVYLQAVTRHIGTVTIAAFDDDGVRQVLQREAGEHPLYIMPLGKPSV